MLVRLVSGAALALGLMASPVMAQTSDVLAPARSGQLQCFEPNAAAKTCQSLGSYVFGADGAIENVAEILLMPSPLIVMRASGPVTVENGAICGPLRAEDIANATFTVNGSPASAEEATQIRAAMQQQLAPMIGVQNCITLTPDGGGFRADSTIAGAPRPDLTQRTIWVDANDGWRVAP
jgi:hypothetical protein